jgi:hypothetical protein
MGNVLVRKADDLKPETRAALTEEEQQELIRRLQDHFDLADKKTKDIPEQEWEDILLEAIRSVRPGYQEHR